MPADTSSGEPATDPATVPGGSVALRLRGVAKTFPGVRALKGIDLDVRSGTVHAILGHNGCGKSTLVKALAGVHQPDPGWSAELDGQPLELGSGLDAEAKGLRFVHQELGLIGELSAVDNVGLVLGYERNGARINWRDQERKTAELLQRFDIKLDARKPLAQAAPVERTAVAIVRAIAGMQPGKGVLVLDEPTAALPANEVEELFRLVRDVKASGTPVILISHRLDEVMAIADHATVMRAGEIVFDGSTQGQSIGTFAGMIADTGAEMEFDDTHRRAPSAFEGKPVTLKLENIQGRYLRGLDLEVREGEIVGVAGLLGSGREELPYVVAGAISDGVTGAFTIGGVTRSKLSIKEAHKLGVALVPADRAREGIIGDFTTQENTSIAALPGLATNRMVVPAEERKFARKWLDRVKAAPDAAPRKITTLSGGNQQKAVLARWLSVEPSLLVLSEPTAGVDIGARMALFDQLRAQAREGLSILLSSSDSEDLLAVCDRVIVLRDGLTVAEFNDQQMSKPAIVAAMEGAEA